MNALIDDPIHSFSHCVSIFFKVILPKAWLPFTGTSSSTPLRNLHVLHNKRRSLVWLEEQGQFLSTAIMNLVYIPIGQSAPLIL
jgi:hypothetical protein